MRTQWLTCQAHKAPLSLRWWSRRRSPAAVCCHPRQPATCGRIHQGTEARTDGEACQAPPFTSNVASLMRLPGKGRIELGCDADLVVLDDAHRVTDVMAGGRWHVRDGAQVIRGTFEARV